MMIHHNGIAYFDTFEEAREHGQRHGKGWPAWRVVSYQLGYAIQVRPSGPYLNGDGEIPFQETESERWERQLREDKNIDRIS